MPVLQTQPPVRTWPAESKMNAPSFCQSIALSIWCSVGWWQHWCLNPWGNFRLRPWTSWLNWWVGWFRIFRSARKLFPYSCGRSYLQYATWQYSRRRTQYRIGIGGARTAICCRRAWEFHSPKIWTWVRVLPDENTIDLGLGCKRTPSRFGQDAPHRWRIRTQEWHRRNWVKIKSCQRASTWDRNWWRGGVGIWGSWNGCSLLVLMLHTNAFNLKSCKTYMPNSLYYWNQRFSPLNSFSFSEVTIMRPDDYRQNGSSSSSSTSSIFYKFLKHIKTIDIFL